MWLAIASDEPLHERVIYSFKMPRWQKDLINTLFPFLRVCEISLEQTNAFTPILIQMRNCILFEDIPQYIGWNISRAYFNKYLDFKSVVQNDRIYLSRRAYEESNDLEARVVDHELVSRLLMGYGFTTIYPEQHSILEMQQILCPLP